MPSSDQPLATLDQLTAVVECGCGQPTECTTLASAIVEHVYARDERRQWMVDAAKRFRRAVTAWASKRPDRPCWTRRWPITLDQVAHSHASPEALVQMLWTFETHDLTDDSIAEDFPSHVWLATRHFAALAGLLLVLDGHIVSTQVLPVLATPQLRCDRLDEWPRSAGELDALVVAHD